MVLEPHRGGWCPWCTGGGAARRSPVHTGRPPVFIDGGDGIGMGHRLDGSVLIPLLLILRQQIDLTS